MSKKRISSHSHASRFLKAELKQAFPSIKFSVTSKTYSGGDNITIEYTDGVHRDSVQEITSKYQYGSFDSSEDAYINHSNTNSLPKVKYVHVVWNHSEDVIVRACENYSGHFGIPFSGDPYKTSEEIKEFTIVHWTFYQAVCHLISKGENMDVFGRFRDSA